MAKRIAFNIACVLVITMILYFGHAYILSEQGVMLSFTLSSIYIFHALAYVVICIMVEIVAERLPSQVGYAYLATVFVKIGLFVLVFKDSIFAAENLPMFERLSLVVPMFIYLILEAIYCGRLMNSK